MKRKKIKFCHRKKMHLLLLLSVCVRAFFWLRHFQLVKSGNHLWESYYVRASLPENDNKI